MSLPAISSRLFFVQEQSSVHSSQPATGLDKESSPPPSTTESETLSAEDSLYLSSCLPVFLEKDRQQSSRLTAADSSSAPPPLPKEDPTSSFSSPIKSAPKPAEYYLKTPDGPHYPKYFEQDSNHKLRKTLKSLPGKTRHHMVIGSAQKDMARIRSEKIQPDEEGNLYVKSKSTGQLRQYRLHPYNSQKQNPKENRLIPVQGHNILEFSGEGVHRCYQKFLASGLVEFEKYLAQEHS